MVDVPKLEALAARFERLARKADALHEKERVSRYVSFVALGVLSARSESYERCADELRRVLAGETPPADGEEWV